MKSIIKLIQEKTLLQEQEAWWMLEHITKKTRAALLHARSSSLSKQELCTIDDWIKKLSCQSMPLSYLIGSVPFLDLTINVVPPILIPRPETEEWVADLVEKMHAFKQNITSILEIGTGSGCIGLTLAKAFPAATVTAIDINPQALKLAQENATLNKINNVHFIQSDLFNNLNNLKFDLIVSNPPYIDPIHKKTIMPQVLEWEDEKALFANQEGLDLIYKIILSSKKHLHYQPDLPYQIILEHDHDQQEKIKFFAQKNGFICHNKKDLFGNFRTSWCKIS